MSITTTADSSTMTFDPVAAFLRRPLNEVVGATLTEINAPVSATRAVVREKTILSLHKLASEYAWVSVLDLTATLLAASDDNPSFSESNPSEDKQKVLLPHERILCSMYRALALLQTRQLDRAATAIQQLGDLSEINTQYHYESYDKQYPGLQGSFIPFELRMLAIEIRMRQGDFDAINDAYELRNEICPAQDDDVNKTNIGEPVENGLDDAKHTEIGRDTADPTDSGCDTAEHTDSGCGSAQHTENGCDTAQHNENGLSEEAKAKKRIESQRLSIILSALASYHLKMGHGDAAVDIGGQLTELCGGMEAWYMYGKLLLHVGDFEGCETAFKNADKEAELESERHPEQATEIEAQQHAHKAMLLGARGKFNEAVIEYDEAGMLFSGDDVEKSSNLTVTVANNAAICLMHVGRLAEAIDRLESVIRKGPELALDEGLVFNLATLYDLAYPDSAIEKKRVLHRLAERFSREGYQLESVGLTL